MKKLLTFLFALMLISSFSFGAGNLFTWNGNVSTDWQDKDNWTKAPLPYGEGNGTSTWPGQSETGDYAQFIGSNVVVTNVPSVTLGRFEVTYVPGGAAGVVFLQGTTDGETVTMRTPSAAIIAENTLWILKIDEGCYLDLNSPGNRVKLVMQAGTNFWYKNGASFYPAKYEDCDGQFGFILETTNYGDPAYRHAEFIQQEFQTGDAEPVLVKGWIQYDFDEYGSANDMNPHYFSPPVRTEWDPILGTPPPGEFQNFWCRRHNTYCVFDGDFGRRFNTATQTWKDWMGICTPILTNTDINFIPGEGFEYIGAINNTPDPGPYYHVYGYFNTPPNPPAVPGYNGPGYFDLPITGANWNFIGNPFPSAIKFDEPSGAPTAGVGWTWDPEKTEPKVYWWDNNLNGPGIAGYRVYNWFTGLGNGSDANVRRIIPRSQGFFVYVANYIPAQPDYEWQVPGVSNVTVGNLARVFRNSLKISKSNVGNHMNMTLVDASNNIIDEAIISFRDDANGTNYNGLLDARKLYNDVSQIYFKTTDEVDAAMKALKLESGNIMYPLYLKVKTSGTYSLSAKDLETFSPNTGIMLKDNVTNTTVDLKVNPVYTFTATEGDDNARFSLYFSNVLYGVDNSNSNNFKVYSYENSIYVQNNSLNSVTGSVVVYDMVGKQMFEEKISNNAITRINTNLTTGFYLVSVKTDMGVVNQKVYIN